MATRKLKNFEFAGYRQDESSDAEGLHTYDAFETPNGFVFLVAGSDRQIEGGQQVCEIIGERIRYYFENDEPGDPKEAARNALVYANGYLFEKARKESGFRPGKASAVCVLVNHGKVYYTWLGSVCLYLFTGKKRHSLTWPVMHPERSGEDTLLFMGQKQMAEPGICQQALVPVDGDMLFLATGTGWENIREKVFCGILADSMPTHTKVQRLAKMISPGHNNTSTASLLVSFYNLDQAERSFVVGKEPPAMSFFEKGRTLIFDQPKSSLVKSLLIAIGVLIIAYMFYDIFLFNPAKPVRVVSQAPQPVLADSMAAAAEAPPASAPEAKPAPPADIQYTVRRGDTWGRIYQQFEVCSWFIRNHPQNTGRFDGAGNPILNSTITIPVRYSASRRFNPNYFQYFTTHRVGNACQNVNEEFKRKADERFGQEN